MIMKRGTTYPITITVPADLTSAEWVIVSIKPRYLPQMDFSRDDMSISYANGQSTIVISLTEEQSVAMTPAPVEIDLNWYEDGIRKGAAPVTFDVSKTLLTRVVTDGE